MVFIEFLLKFNYLQQLKGVGAGAMMRTDHYLFVLNTRSHLFGFLIYITCLPI